MEGGRERERNGGRERKREGGREIEREREIIILSTTHHHPLLQCDANPDATKLVVQEDKYENILTLITYYQMASQNKHSTEYATCTCLCMLHDFL